MNMKSCRVNEYNIAADHYSNGKFRSAEAFKIIPKEAYLSFSIHTIHVTQNARLHFLG